MLTLVSGKTNQTAKSMQYIIDELNKPKYDLITFSSGPIPLDLLHFLIHHDKDVIISTPQYLYKNDIENGVAICLSVKDLTSNSKINFKALLAENSKGKMNLVESILLSIKSLTGGLTIQNNSSGVSPFDETKVGTLPIEVINAITSKKESGKVQQLKTPEELVDKLLVLLEGIKSDISSLKEEIPNASYNVIKYDLETIICIMDTLEDRNKFMRKTDVKIERLIGDGVHRDLNMSRDNDDEDYRRGSRDDDDYRRSSHRGDLRRGGGRGDCRRGDRD